MALEIALVLVIPLLAVVLFMTERVQVDVVIVLLALALTKRLPLGVALQNSGTARFDSEEHLGFDYLPLASAAAKSSSRATCKAVLCSISWNKYHLNELVGQPVDEGYMCPEQLTAAHLAILCLDPPVFDQRLNAVFRERKAPNGSATSRSLRRQSALPRSA